MPVSAELREKNRANQKRYREKLKNSNSYRLTVTIEKETFNRIRDIAQKAKITQGEVIDRILKGGAEMSITAAETVNPEVNVVRTIVDRFRHEDFALSELAIDTIARMLGFNLKDTMTEEAKNEPDMAKLAALKEGRKQFLNEQRLIYGGNKEVMKTCNEKYGAMIRARYEGQ